jgi:aerobic carbon-monoxide dehydrogenase small subunit
VKSHVRTTINGTPTEALVDAGATVLQVLRDQLFLTGTKEGCGTGDCGACSIMLDDVLVCSCLVLAPELDGSRVRTVEGIAEEGRLHPVQQQLLEHAGLQCGVCTPGFVVAAVSLLEQHADPTEEDIRYWLAGNLCRCTGYDKIIRAVQDAAREVSSEEAQ